MDEPHPGGRQHCRVDTDGHAGTGAGRCCTARPLPPPVTGCGHCQPGRGRVGHALYRHAGVHALRLGQLCTAAQRAVFAAEPAGRRLCAAHPHAPRAALQGCAAQRPGAGPGRGRHALLGHARFRGHALHGLRPDGPGAGAVTGHRLGDFFRHGVLPLAGDWRERYHHGATQRQRHGPVHRLPALHRHGCHPPARGLGPRRQRAP